MRQFFNHVFVKTMINHEFAQLQYIVSLTICIMECSIISLDEFVSYFGQIKSTLSLIRAENMLLSFCPENLKEEQKIRIVFCQMCVFLFIIIFSWIFFEVIEIFLRNKNKKFSDRNHKPTNIDDDSIKYGLKFKTQ